MLAALLTGFGSPLQVAEIPVPTPGAGELLVRVEATGVCGTDLHIVAGDSYRPILPFVLGHEPCGVVADIGLGVDEAWLGRRIVPSIFEGCGECSLCATSDERLCADNRSILGVSSRAGGFAEFLTLPERLAIAVPASVDPLSAAMLVDAGTTAVNAVRALTGRGSPATVLIAGGGPVGWFIAHLARVQGIVPTIAEPNPARSQALEAAGFQTVPLVSGMEGSMQFAVDAAGAPGVLTALIDTVRPSGTLVVVGYHGSDSVNAAGLARREISVIGVRSGRKADLAMAMAAAETGDISLPEMSVWSLPNIALAFDALYRGSVAGKAIIDVGQVSGVSTSKESHGR